MRTVADIVAATSKPGLQLAAPEYRPNSNADEQCRVGLGVESMRRHMTDEGWQLFAALDSAGYWVLGGGYFREGPGHSEYAGRVDVKGILSFFGPSTVAIQDKREWTGRTAGPGFDERERFRDVEALRTRPDIFKVTALKDAHSDQEFHREAAEEIGCHAWIIYYHPRIVAAQAPYVRPEHLIRTYHSVDPAVVPEFSSRRMPQGLISGAVSGAYPLRTRICLEAGQGRLKNVEAMRHPGYGRSRCCTPDYIRLLSTYKVAICTSSRFGYAVRKIIEATAAGCIVVTDLPSDDVLPEIDGNLVRVDPDISPRRVDELVGELAASYSPDRQQMWAERAKRYYDYRALGKKLADDIENLRRSYV